MEEIDNQFYKILCDESPGKFLIHFYKDKKYFECNHIMLGDDCAFTNVILDSCPTFYKNIKYCPFTGLLFEIVGANDDVVIAEILSLYEIDIIKNVLIGRVNIQSQYNIDVFEMYKIWAEVYSIHGSMVGDKPGELEMQVVDQNRELVYEKRKTPISNIYLMYDTITHYHKIGISSKPSERYKTLMSDRNSMELIKYFQCESHKEAYRLERALHKYFEEFRNNGEWFKLNHLSNEQIFSIYYEVADEFMIDICDPNDF